MRVLSISCGLMAILFSIVSVYGLDDEPVLGSPMSINGSSADYTSDSGSRVDEFDATITGDIVQEIEDIPDYGGPGKWNPAIISDVTLSSLTQYMSDGYHTNTNAYTEVTPTMPPASSPPYSGTVPGVTPPPVGTERAGYAATSGAQYTSVSNSYSLPVFTYDTPAPTGEAVGTGSYSTVILNSTVGMTSLRTSTVAPTNSGFRNSTTNATASRTGALPTAISNSAGSHNPLAATAIGVLVLAMLALGL